MEQQKYQKMEHKEHIYKLPDTYIGSIEFHSEEMFVKTNSEDKILFEKKKINYVPGFYKIFDEILVNALDHRQRDNSVKNIKVNISHGLSEISIFNDGEGIDICLYDGNDDEKQIYIPELLFSHLLTSTNYNQNEKKTTGGKNGYGSKLTCIFSKSFIIETIDSKRQLKYVQKILNNNSEVQNPKITKYTSKPYTKIIFFPDYDRFGLSEGITDDIYKLLERRVYDATATTPSDLNIYLNSVKLKIKTLAKYSELYFDTSMYKGFYTETERWKIGIVLSPNREYTQISFVNGIWTMKGGKHVDYVLNQIIDRLKQILSKHTKTKGKTFRTNQIKDNIWLFIDSIIENPSFTSQTKEELTTKSTQFGSTCVLNDIDDKLLDKFIKYQPIDELSFVDRMVEHIKTTTNQAIKKTDGAKKNILKGIPKLDDAFLAGTRNSLKCTLILTEGDSAKASVMSGLSVLGSSFRETFGIFPLRGKFLNVRDCSIDKITNNEEVKNLKTILGLQQGKVYTKENLKELRYGSIAITTDADHDGSHIKGLLLNFLHYFWPSLLQIDGFVKTIITPIIKGFRNQQTISFYTLKEFEKFREQHIGEKWEYKYYKGLGTSTGKEFKEYFKKLKDITIEYKWESKDSKESKDSEDSILMAFSKDRANSRKEWLGTYDPHDTIEYSSDKQKKSIILSEFIHRELKHFSNYDNIRSIPNIMDGLKPSQRKVIYGLIHKNPKEIKVAQLASFVSEFTSYHHGEVSLEQTIVNLAQSFVGKNNLPLLFPKGQFGTRLTSKDNAQSRYIYTYLQKWTLEIFNSDDDPLLEKLEDDGKQIEPRVYYPIIPMVLVNGVDGIGTGYSTNIPPFNPLELCDVLIERNNGNTEAFKKKWIPYYRGFKGKIIESEHNKFVINGNYEYDEKTNRLTITELPIGLWTQTFKELLEHHIELGNISSYVDKSTDEDVHFEILLSKISCSTSDIEKLFKLSSKISMNNMYLYIHKYEMEQSHIYKFNSVEDILDYYYTERLYIYIKRKEFTLQKLKEQLQIIEEKIRFIQEVINTPEIVFRQTKDKIRKRLQDNNYIHIDTLLNIPIFHWSEEKISELIEQQKKIIDKIEFLSNKSEENLWNDDLLKLRDYLFYQYK